MITCMLPVCLLFACMIFSSSKHPPPSSPTNNDTHNNTKDRSPPSLDQEKTGSCVCSRWLAAPEPTAQRQTDRIRRIQTHTTKTAPYRKNIPSCWIVLRISPNNSPPFFSQSPVSLTITHHSFGRRGCDRFTFLLASFARVPRLAYIFLYHEIRTGSLSACRRGGGCDGRRQQWPQSDR